MPFDLRLFGKRLREIRKDRGLSQVQLAGHLGAANGWISELENARQTHVQADTVHRFCEALDVSADYLLGLSDTPGARLATPPKHTRRTRAREPDEEPAWQAVGR